MWKAARKKNSEKTPQSCRGWWKMHASILSRCQKGRDGRTPFERLRGKKPTQEFVPFGEKVLARPRSSEPLNRMNPGYKFGVWLEVKNNSAECFVGTAGGVLRAHEVRRIEHQHMWVKGVLWRMVDRQVDYRQAGDGKLTL